MSRALRKWHKLQERLRDAQAMASAARQSLIDHEQAYLRGNTLPATTKQALVAALEAGRPLCCEAGKKVLADLCDDELWCKVLSAWAYDHATCGDTDRAYWARNAEKLAVAFAGGHFDPLYEHAKGDYW